MKKLLLLSLLLFACSKEESPFTEPVLDQNNAPTAPQYAPPQALTDCRVEGTRGNGAISYALTDCKGSESFRLKLYIGGVESNWSKSELILRLAMPTLSIQEEPNLSATYGPDNKPVVVK